MPDVNVKYHNQILETLINMLNGVKRYKGDEGFPPAIKEEILTEMINNLRAAREAYEQTYTMERRLYDDYNSQILAVSEKLSRYKMMLYGFYGKQNLIVTDFGIKPFKTKVKKTKPSQMIPATEPVPTTKPGQAA